MRIHGAAVLLLVLCAGTCKVRGRQLSGIENLGRPAGHELADGNNTSRHAGRQLLACDLSFQARRNDQLFDSDYRLATLQDVTDPVTVSLQGVLSDGSVALLVDGWVSFSDNPPQTYTGSNERDFVLRTKLGIHDCGLGQVGIEPGLDIVPMGADPSQVLQKRDDASAALAKRAPTITKASAKEVGIIKDVIKAAIEAGFDSIDVAKQRTLYLDKASGFRLDQQSNGVFQVDGDDFVQLAVQRGSSVFASILVPFKQRVSAGGMRKLLFESLEQQKVRRFVRPPQSYKGLYTWLIIATAAVYLIAPAAALPVAAAGAVAAIGTG